MARISGKDGRFYFWTGSAFLYVADLYEWELDYEQVVLDASIKSDIAERYTPSHHRGRLMAKRWTEDITNSLAFANQVASNARFEFAVVGQIATADTSGAGFSTAPVRFQATGYITRGHVLSPSEAGTQDNIEIQLDTYPAVFA
jgi:hypothetical protein